LPATLQTKPAHFVLERHSHGIRGRFKAMASPCEVLVETQDEQLAENVVTVAVNEALRIEQTFCRYRERNLIHKINNANGEAVAVDEELARLLDFVDHCYRISDGLFDVTAGVLRRAWRFDGSDRLPSRKQVKSLMNLVGWSKAHWRIPNIQLQPGMEIDLGGIGKEYAVDRALLLAEEISDTPILINFGGDLKANRAPTRQQSWQVGIELSASAKPQPFVLSLDQGAYTTSGDARRYLMRNGKRYGHVLNPRTGWSVSQAPSSVTVKGDSCTETGVLSTMAMLKGKEAERFLQAQGVEHWIQR